MRNGFRAQSADTIIWKNRRSGTLIIGPSIRMKSAPHAASSQGSTWARDGLLSHIARSTSKVVADGGVRMRRPPRTGIVQRSWPALVSRPHDLDFPFYSKSA